MGWVGPLGVLGDQTPPPLRSTVTGPRLSSVSSAVFISMASRLSDTWPFFTALISCTHTHTHTHRGSLSREVKGRGPATPWAPDVKRETWNPSPVLLLHVLKLHREEKRRFHSFQSERERERERESVSLFSFSLTKRIKTVLLCIFFIVNRTHERLLTLGASHRVHRLMRRRWN